ncbi:MAG: antitoxin [Solirubrobacteraceae bacterium]
MKTTLELPDELLRAVKVRAAREDRRLKDVTADLLRHGLAVAERVADPALPRRVRLPLVHCAHEASPDGQATPERVAEILIADEAAATIGKGPQAQPPPPLPETEV